MNRKWYPTSTLDEPQRSLISSIQDWILHCIVKFPEQPATFNNKIYYAMLGRRNDYSHQMNCQTESTLSSWLYSWGVHIFKNALIQSNMKQTSVHTIRFLRREHQYSTLKVFIYTILNAKRNKICEIASTRGNGENMRTIWIWDQFGATSHSGL